MQLEEKKQVVIIGAGSAGLCMGVQLKKAGIHDFVILEKGSGIGGTWWHNSYPGAECDVQSHLYSFSFEQKNDWSRPFAGQAEILEYLNLIADKYDLRKHILLETEVKSAQWDGEKSCWLVTTADGTNCQSRVVVSALGMFNNLVWPSIPGREEFAGKYFHSARWDHTHDLKGKRVGVIGIAASAIQFVPEIAQKEDELYLYQRTANWVVPKENTPYSQEQIERFTREPELVQQRREEIYQTWNTLCTFNDKKVLSEIERSGLERLATVKDEEVRKQLTPTHPFGCKRPLISDVYYPVFNQNNVELITDTIERITPTGITTINGKAREVDTIIFSTGFETTTYLSALDVTGRDGRQLKDAWSDGAQAYLGITTAGFPNLFMLYGPNTNQGSILFMLERQCDYIMRQLGRLADEDLAWMDVRPDVMNSFNNQLQKDISLVDVWQAECGNDFYYRSNSGRFVTNWPYSMDEFTARTTKSDAEAYEVQRSA